MPSMTEVVARVRRQGSDGIARHEPQLLLLDADPGACWPSFG